jgi:hypothetical protein
LAFVPSYGVSLAERIIPASDVSIQISTAGTEASGTSNMKLALNGALTIGTLDGANVEIREAVGPENFFLFGMSTPEVAALCAQGYDPKQLIARSPALAEALELIGSGFFSLGDKDRFKPIVDHSTLRYATRCVLRVRGFPRLRRGGGPRGALLSGAARVVAAIALQHRGREQVLERQHGAPVCRRDLADPARQDRSLAGLHRRRSR